MKIELTPIQNGGCDSRCSEIYSLLLIASHRLGYQFFFGLGILKEQPG